MAKKSDESKKKMDNESEMSVKEIITKRRQKAMREQGLELVQLLRVISNF